MLSITPSMPAMRSLENLSRANQQTQTSIARLSSGLRITGAKDDAAGNAIANRMSTNLIANSKVGQGIRDGANLIRVAEGALGTINEMVHRGRELALQAANGTLTDSDRQAIDTEFQQLKSEIDRIAKSTEAFGKYPLAPAPKPPEPEDLTPHIRKMFPTQGRTYDFMSGIVSVAYVPAGTTNFTLNMDAIGIDDDIQVFTRSGKHLVGTPIDGDDPDRVWRGINGIMSEADANDRLLTRANGFAEDAAYDGSDLIEGGETFDLNGSVTATVDGMTFTYSGDGDRYEDDETGVFNDGNVLTPAERLHIDEVTEDLVLLVVGEGSFLASATWDNLPPAPREPVIPNPQDTRILMSANYGDDASYLTIKATPADAESLGIDLVSLAGQNNALEALASFDQALETINTYRSTYGALSSRLDSAVANLGVEAQATSAARSRVLDADMAVEASAMARSQILQQASTAMLAQANQTAQGVLSLLR